MEWVAPHVTTKLEPCVGIFWLFGRGVICEITPFSQAEHGGGCLNHRRDHLECWTELQSIGAVPRESEYDEIPRGRVLYRIATQQYVIYADRCIPQNAIRAIVAALHLRRRVRVISRDAHYRCPRCMAGDL